MKAITQNTLFYGDNLNIMREYIPSESIDLIYLDPPFNSSRNYNVLFKDESGQDSDAQLRAFEDSWHWDRKAEDTYHELITDSPEQISAMIAAFRQFVGANQMMAYLVMMTARLIELHRVLKDTGSLYLHCDPTASHYLKIVLDTIWGKENFRNEVIWHYLRWPAKQKNFQQMHDVILFYSKTYLKNSFNVLLEPLSKGTLKRWKGKKSVVEFEGDRRLVTQMSDEDSPGRPADDVWNIPVINSQAKERLGYPTQKPLALLERIIQASSNEGDWILDPFAGCGTTVAAAEKLGRRWIGIDITHLAISLLKYRLRDMQETVAAVRSGADWQVIGEPKDLSGAAQLAKDDRYQFQWWALSLVQAKPVGGDADSKKGKKGSDRGIDGVITLIDDPYEKPKKILIQVKSGKVGVRDIRDLLGTVVREEAALGVFITLEKPTADMKTESVSAGHYFSPGWNKNYPKIQILTVEELLKGGEILMPPVRATFKEAKKEAKRKEVQDKFF